MEMVLRDTGWQGRLRSLQRLVDPGLRPGDGVHCGGRPLPSDIQVVWVIRRDDWWHKWTASRFGRSVRLNYVDGTIVVALIGVSVLGLVPSAPVTNVLHVDDGKSTDHYTGPCCFFFCCRRCICTAACPITCRSLAIEQFEADDGRLTFLPAKIWLERGRQVDGPYDGQWYELAFVA